MSYHSTVRACSVILSKRWNQRYIRAVRAIYGALMSVMAVCVISRSSLSTHKGLARSY